MDSATAAALSRIETELVGIKDDIQGFKDDLVHRYVSQTEIAPLRSDVDSIRADNKANAALCEARLVALEAKMVPRAEYALVRGLVFGTVSVMLLMLLTAMVGGVIYVAARPVAPAQQTGVR